MNWITDKVESKVVAEAQLHYAEWLSRLNKKDEVC